MNNWIKHDKSIICPIDGNLTVEIETWTPLKAIYKANMIYWPNVKYYRVVSEKK